VAIKHQLHSSIHSSRSSRRGERNEQRCKAKWVDLLPLKTFFFIQYYCRESISPSPVLLCYIAMFTSLNEIYTNTKRIFISITLLSFFPLDWNRINWKTRGGQKLIILLYFQLNVKYIYTNWSLMYEKIGFSHFKKEIGKEFWYWVEGCL